MDDLPVDDLPVDDLPVDDLPVDDLPVDDLPVDDLPVDDLPVDDLPVDDLPVDDLPVDDLPVDAVSMISILLEPKKGSPSHKFVQSRNIGFRKATSMYNARKKVLRLKVCRTFFMHLIATGVAKFSLEVEFSLNLLTYSVYSISERCTLQFFQVVCPNTFNTNDLVSAEGLKGSISLYWEQKCKTFFL